MHFVVASVALHVQDRDPYYSATQVSLIHLASFPSGQDCFSSPPPRLLFSSEELTVGGVVVGAVSYGASLLQCSRGVGVDGHSILAEVPVHVALVVCIWSVCRSSQVHFRSRFTLSGEDNRVNVLLDEHVRVGDGVGRHCIGSRQGEEDLGHYLD